MEQTFSATDLVRLTDLTYRQCDHWCSLGVLRPLHGANPGSGVHREFAESEVVIAAVVAQLSELGAQVQSVCRRVALQLRAGWTPDAFPDRKLYVTPEGEIRHEPCAPGWIVSLDEILDAA